MDSVASKLKQSFPSLTDASFVGQMTIGSPVVQISFVGFVEIRDMFRDSAGR